MDEIRAALPEILANIFSRRVQILCREVAAEQYSKTYQKKVHFHTRTRSESVLTGLRQEQD